MSHSAVILIEFQRQWTDPGLYHRLIRGQLDSRAVLDRTRRLVQSARKHAACVIHAPLVIDPARKQGWLAHLTLGKVFTKDTLRAELSEGLHEAADLTVRGRTRFDAFAGSDLEELIRAEGIDQLYFCGITTEYCVAITMRTAQSLGFESTMVSDCTATRNGRIQRRIEREFEPLVLSSREVIDRLAESTGPATRDLSERGES